MLITELDIPYLQNVVLNFDLSARYYISAEYGAQFGSQSSIFGSQTNVELSFFLCQSSRFGINRIRRSFSISELDMVLNV